MCEWEEQCNFEAVDTHIIWIFLACNTAIRFYYNELKRFLRYLKCLIIYVWFAFMSTYITIEINMLNVNIRYQLHVESEMNHA
jgi:hypothetical protein